MVSLKLEAKRTYVLNRVCFANVVKMRLNLLRITVFKFRISIQLLNMCIELFVARKVQTVWEKSSLSSRQQIFFLINKGAMVMEKRFPCVKKKRNKSQLRRAFYGCLLIDLRETISLDIQFDLSCIVFLFWPNLIHLICLKYTTSFHEGKRFYCISGSEGNDSIIDCKVRCYCMIDCMTRVSGYTYSCKKDKNQFQNILIQEM